MSGTYQYRLYIESLDFWSGIPKPERRTNSMKKFMLMLLAALMVCGLVGCTKKDNDGKPLDDSQDVVDNVENAGPLVWGQIESKVIELESSLTALADEHPEGLVPASEEEVDALVKRVEAAYELVKSGFTTAHEEATLDLYDAARRLELSGNEHVMSLGTAAKDLMLGMLGHTVVEDMDALHDNVNAALAYVHSVLDEPVSEPQEEAEPEDSAAK